MAVGYRGSAAVRRDSHGCMICLYCELPPGGWLIAGVHGGGVLQNENENERTSERAAFMSKGVTMLHLTCCMVDPGTLTQRVARATFRWFRLFT